jgi:hypothetical protein
VPSERSRGANVRRGSITKAGNAHALARDADSQVRLARARAADQGEVALVTEEAAAGEIRARASR